MSLIRGTLLAWDSCPSVCLSRAGLLRLSYAKNLSEPIRVELVGAGLVGAPSCRVFNGALIFFLLVPGSTVQHNVLLPLCLILALSPTQNIMPNARSYSNIC